MPNINGKFQPITDPSTANAISSITSLRNQFRVQTVFQAPDQQIQRPQGIRNPLPNQNAQPNLARAQQTTFQQIRPTAGRVQQFQPARINAPQNQVITEPQIVQEIQPSRTNVPQNQLIRRQQIVQQFQPTGTNAAQAQLIRRYRRYRRYSQNVFDSRIEAFSCC